MRGSDGRAARDRSDGSCVWRAAAVPFCMHIHLHRYRCGSGCLRACIHIYTDGMLFHMRVCARARVCVCCVNAWLHASRSARPAGAARVAAAAGYTI